MSMNPILLQKTIRDNAADLNDFARDLKSWGQEMKRKEEALKENNEPTCSTKKLPQDSKIVKKIKPTNNPKPPARKIAGTDYAKWDKFDVYAELDRLDSDTVEDSELTDECNENVYDVAIIEKEKGNKHVKDKNWSEAVKCYTKAIKGYSYDPVFYANRALCYLKLKKYEECEEDCNLSLKLDETYVKAYQRRAAARMHLNKLEHAEVDLKKILILEPKNKEAKLDLDKITVLLKRNLTEVNDQRPVSKFTASRNKLNNTNFKPTTSTYQPQKEPVYLPEVQIDDSNSVPMWVSDPEIIEIKPIMKPPHLRSKKPLKRLVITEIDDTTTVIQAKLPENKDIVKKHVLEKKEVSEKISENKKVAEETDKTVCSSNDDKLHGSLFKNKKSFKLVEEVDLPLLNPKNNLQLLKTEDLKVVERLNPSTTPKDVKNTVNGSKKLTDSADNYLNYPKNSVQFYNSWKNFKTTQDKYKYLKSLKPMDLSKIFLNSLDISLFSNILEVMAKHFVENKDDIYGFLSNFTQVKRFGAIVMFMSGEDKSNIWKLIDHIKENKEKDGKEVDWLIEKYEL